MYLPGINSKQRPRSNCGQHDISFSFTENGTHHSAADDMLISFGIIESILATGCVCVCVWGGGGEGGFRLTLYFFNKALCLR